MARGWLLGQSLAQSGRQIRKPSSFHFVFRKRPRVFWRSPWNLVASRPRLGKGGPEPARLVLPGTPTPGGGFPSRQPPCLPPCAQEGTVVTASLGQLTGSGEQHGSPGTRETTPRGAVSLQPRPPGVCPARLRPPLRLGTFRGAERVLGEASVGVGGHSLEAAVAASPGGAPLPPQAPRSVSHVHEQNQLKQPVESWGPVSPGLFGFGGAEP